MIYDLVRFASWLWFSLFHRLAIKGAENVPQTGGAIIASNHASGIDPFVLGAASRRSITFIARGTLAERRLFRMLTRGVHVVAISRNESDRAALRAINQELEEGRICGIFPEGTRSLDGRLQPFKSGVALIAQKAGVPVIPTYVAGSFQVWPKGRCVPRLFAKVVVRFGEPLHFERGMNRKECLLLLRAAMTRLAAHEGVAPEETPIESPESGDDVDRRVGSALKVPTAQGCGSATKSVSAVEPASL